MKICVIGTGYVGLVTAACFAEMGNEVICVDVDKKKIDLLNDNQIPIYEPRLEELVKNNRKGGRLNFTTDVRTGIENSLLLFIAVGTPTLPDGSADLQYVLSVARSIGQSINDYKVVINKSTVPVGTGEKVRAVIQEEMKKTGKSFMFDMVSNPEFLKEGAAIDDFMRPDRVVIGADNEKAADLMNNLYAPFVKNGHPIIMMDIKSAEITKYAANGMLATRISFMNEISRLCEKTGADVNKVRVGIGTDTRIGMAFLYAGLGYGGSCFPKDVKALMKTFSEIGEESELFHAVNHVNESQRLHYLKKIHYHFDHQMKDKVFAVWGLAFKPNTDDMRDAPSVTIIQDLIKKGAKIQAFDPEAVGESRKIFGEDHPQITYFKNQYEALSGADALLLLTEWNCFKEPDFDKMASLLKQKVVFDGRNIYDKQKMILKEFQYYCIGR